MSTALADYLKRTLGERDWSERTLAMYADVSPSTISRTTRGRTTPDPETVRRIARALEVDEVGLLTLAGHVEAARADDLDTRALYIAQRLSELSPDVREIALDALGAVLDSIYALARAPFAVGHPGASQGLLVDSAALYDVAPQEEARPSDAALVEEIIGELAQLSNEEELVRLLTIAYHHDPEGVREVARIRAARRAAAEGRQ